MSIFDIDSAPEPAPRPAVLASELDVVLTAQLVVAWAGEGGEQERLGWWRSDLVSEFGGQDLFRRLLPHTWAWAVLQGAREAARRKDAELRRQDHSPDRILSLFSLGFELDERVEERLQDLKKFGREPSDALPGLAQWTSLPWNRDSFLTWVREHGDPETVPAPVGRRLKAAPPASAAQMANQLVAALSPVGDNYPLPHFRKLT